MSKLDEINDKIANKLFDILRFNKLETEIHEQNDLNEAEKKYMVDLFKIYESHGIDYNTFVQINKEITELQARFIMSQNNPPGTHNI